MDIDVIDRPLIRLKRADEITVGDDANDLYTYGKPMFELREKFHNTLIAFGVPWKLVTLIKIYLNENYNLCVYEHLPDTFLFRMVSDTKMLFRFVFSNFASNISLGKSKKTKRD